MTIEEAQARILELETENESIKTERDSLLQDKNELSNSLEKARELNQKLFERVSVDKSKDEEDEDDEPETPSCEEFAKSIINSI